MEFAENPVYRKFLGLLLRLDELMAIDQGEFEEADSLRDDMEDIYWELSAAERQRLNSISVYLYTLHSEKLSERRTKKI